MNSPGGTYTYHGASSYTDWRRSKGINRFGDDDEKTRTCVHFIYWIFCRKTQKKIYTKNSDRLIKNNPREYRRPRFRGDRLSGVVLGKREIRRRTPRGWPWWSRDGLSPEKWRVAKILLAQYISLRIILYVTVYRSRLCDARGKVCRRRHPRQQSRRDRWHEQGGGGGALVNLGFACAHSIYFRPLLSLV